MIRIIHKDTSLVTSEPSEVIVEGPEATDFSLTPAAAVHTAKDLLASAEDASDKQSVMDDVGRRLLALKKRLH